MIKFFKAMLGAALALAVWPAGAHAENGRWMRIESAHFIVYGENGEAKLREAVRTLEMYDAELRHLLNAARLKERTSSKSISCAISRAYAKSGLM